MAGLVIGAWGTVQATAIGVSLAAGGLLRDVVAALAERGVLGAAMRGTAVPYSVVYHLEIGLLFAALVTLGPLVAARQASRGTATRAPRFGLADLPG
jgi:BCD family chlorophyll transporter-like MFS transporter